MPKSTKQQTSTKHPQTTTPKKQHTHKTAARRPIFTLLSTHCFTPKPPAHLPKTVAHPLPWPGRRARSRALSGTVSRLQTNVRSSPRAWDRKVFQRASNRNKHVTILVHRNGPREPRPPLPSLEPPKAVSRVVSGDLYRSWRPAESLLKAVSRVSTQ